MSLSERRWAWPALAGVLIAAISLRLWGIGQGLPYVYNLDESDHFVPHAVAMFRHGLDPHYFANPPALTYLLHLLFAVWFGGASGVQHAYAHSPEDFYVLARVVTAVLGTAAVWLLYLVGARLFDRRVGLLAAAIEAVAFLPVFYSHLALNDVPALAPLTLSLLGSAGVLRRGRPLDYLIAGVGLGLACATKYTAGIVLLPLLAAVAARHLERREGRPAERGANALPAISGLAIAGAAALAAFLLANPYALIDYQGFRRGLVHQSTISGEAQGKLGAPSGGGLPYYLWSLTWGLGWVPALAALGGALTIWRRDRRLGWLLVPPAVVFLLFMGVQGRYFGRWLLPIVPIACLLAAFLALELGRGLAGRGARARPAALALAVAALCLQGLLYSVHSSLVLSRADTRNLTRAWMVGHVPAGSSIVVEPVVPNAWVTDVAHAGSSGEPRWVKYASLRTVIDPRSGVPEPAEGRKVRSEDYERTLSPALISHYEQQGYCWVVTGSTQSGRAFADPRAVPQAIAYYRALARQASLVYSASPYRTGHGPVPFGFDWSFDYYPLAYERP
ncbi:MAG TPA: glycosyltransferase family 39 protein, partial [Solirubrobacteraceae bacterium]|nr:glycosyltransferase family 39 protein [Solirubrobacteraceae bacterium]